MSETTKDIYLDSNATSLPFPEVMDEFQRTSLLAFANPGSPHAAGLAARETYTKARGQVASCLDADPSQVIFTSGGTEAINMALVGRALRIGATAAPPQTIRFQLGEHPATTMCAKHLCSQGWKQETFGVDANGEIDHAAIAKFPWHENDIATFLLAHNETGIIQDPESLSPLIQQLRGLGVWTHIDAVQAVGKIDVSFRELGPDSLSIASHKFHGPRGIGALLLRGHESGSNQNRLGFSELIEPLLFGGGQEDGLRPGTQCVPLAAAMAKALEVCGADASRGQRVASRRSDFENQLAIVAQELGIEISIHGRAVRRLPNTTFVSFLGYESPQILKHLIDSGIQCSAGAACKSDSLAGSQILTAMGCSQAASVSPIRFSLDDTISESDIKEAMRRIASALQTLKRDLNVRPA